MATAAVAKRIPVESEVNTVDAAAGIVADIAVRLAQARERGEQINDAIRAVAYDAARGDGDAVKRLADLRGDAERVRAETGDLTVAVTEARERLVVAEQAQRDAADAATLDYARALGEKFVAQSELIDDALRTIVAAHGERAKLRAAILQTGCLHPTRHSALDCPTRLHHAVCVAGATFLAPGQPPASGVVFAIYSLALADRETLAALSIANRNSRSPF